MMKRGSHSLDHTFVLDLVQEYDLGEFEGLEELAPGFANRNYKLILRATPVLLRWVLEKDLSEVAAELHILKMLRQHDFPTAYPISKSRGGFVTTFERGHLVLYDFIEGVHPELNAMSCKAVGEAVGKLSRIPIPEQGLKSNTINLEDARELITHFGRAENQFLEIFSWFESRTEELVRVVRHDLPRGLVHADVFPDNTLYEGDELRAIVDFEEVCGDVLLFDLAMTINGFCFPGNQLAPALLESLVRSYNQQRRLSDLEWDQLPIYMEWTAHGMLAWHLRRLLKKPTKRQEERVNELQARVDHISRNGSEISRLLNHVRQTSNRGS